MHETCSLLDQFEDQSCYNDWKTIKRTTPWNYRYLLKDNPVSEVTNVNQAVTHLYKPTLLDPFQ